MKLNYFVHQQFIHDLFRKLKKKYIKHHILDPVCKYLPKGMISINRRNFTLI